MKCKECGQQLQNDGATVEILDDYAYLEIECVSCGYRIAHEIDKDNFSPVDSYFPN
jgi:DNA-directed RNA polymerase subunit RPC12/RpoP